MKFQVKTGKKILFESEIESEAATFATKLARSEGISTTLTENNVPKFRIMKDSGYAKYLPKAKHSNIIWN